MGDKTDKSDSMSRLFQSMRPAGMADASPDDDPDALSVAQMDGKYSTMRAANKILTRMHVVDKTGKVRSFQYVFLDVESRFDGELFTVIFAGTKHWQVTVKGHGPKFWMIYDLITLHRWPYLREATGSMPGAGVGDDTVLTEIKIQDVTPRERE